MKNNFFKHSNEIKKKSTPLTLADFPEMIKDINPIQTIKKDKPQISFIDKVKTEKQVITVNDNVNNYKPGWTYIFKDKKTNKTMYVEYTSLTKPVENCNKVLNYLVALHNYRKNKYIEMWGEDEYEKMFRFPNYNYEYFDKLDEKAYLEALDNESVDSSSEDDKYDYY
jgi:hypothetical protein